MNPPIITTTAATPQDSPITTLAHGMNFSDWENNCLKPPSVVGSVKALNNLLLPEPYPTKRKIDNISVRNSGNTSIELESKASLSNIRIDRKDSTANDRSEQNQNQVKSKSKQSLKKRSSTKRKQQQKRSDSQDADTLNSERFDSIGNLDTPHRQSKRIQNNGKNTNKVSPRGSKQLDSNEYYYNKYLEHQHSIPGHAYPRGSVAYRRRMSTMDPEAFRKLAQLDLQQLELLRERALRRDAKLKTEPSTTIQVEPPIVKSFVHAPIKYTEMTVRQHFEKFTEGREAYALYIFAEDNQFREMCDTLVTRKWFDNVILLFIALNCITLAMERPNIPPNCGERYFLATANYVFTFVFTLEMFVKVNFHLNL